MAMRQLIEHSRLPQFVGSLDRKAPFNRMKQRESMSANNE